MEEEVVRLEEQVVHFRQDLYQEAVYISSSKRSIENSADSHALYPVKNHKPERCKFSAQNEGDSTVSTMGHRATLSCKFSDQINLKKLHSSCLEMGFETLSSSFIPR